MTTERVSRIASEVQVGDRVFFPSSRHAAKVDQVLVQDTYVTLFANEGKMRWMVKSDMDLAILIESEEEAPDAG